MPTTLDISLLNPVKFVPNTIAPGYPHFDNDWMVNQIKSFENKVRYYQKWQVGDITPIQIESSLVPEDLKVYDCNRQVVGTIPFILTAPGGSLGINIYEAVVDLDSLPVNSVYYLYIQATFMNINYEAISEPIRLQAEWPNTMLFTYRNSVNNWGVAFTTGVEFNFRCEAGIMEFQPESDTYDYVDQIHNIEVLTGTPYRTFKLFIGDAKGVAPWVLDLLNRMMVCDHWEAESLQYAKNTGAKWEVNRVKPWPLYGGSIEIVESINKSSLQFYTPDGFQPGVVTSYNIDTNFFGTTKEDQHILDIKQT